MRQGHVGDISLYFPLGMDEMDPKLKKKIELYLDTIKAIGRTKEELRGRRGKPKKRRGSPRI